MAHIMVHNAKLIFSDFLMLQDEIFDIVLIYSILKAAFLKLLHG